MRNVLDQRGLRLRDPLDRIVRLRLFRLHDLAVPEEVRPAEDRRERRPQLVREHREDVIALSTCGNRALECVTENANDVGAFFERVLRSRTNRLETLAGSGDDHDRRVGRDAVEPGQRLEPGRIRQGEIEEHDIEPSVVREELRRVGEARDALDLDVWRGDESARIPVTVLDQQYAHRRPSRRQDAITYRRQRATSAGRRSAGPPQRASLRTAPREPCGRGEAAP